MRRSLGLPAMLFEWFECAEDADIDALAAQIGAERLPGARRVWLGRGEGGVGVVSVWETGREALEAREAASLGEIWRSCSPLIGAQPRVHLMASQGLDWPGQPAGPVSLMFVTTDVESIEPHEGARAPRALLPRESLPQIEGALIWPVIGHPGRLMVWWAGEGWDEAAVSAAIAEAWGPGAEAPTTFTLAQLDPS